jgi:hypothetical protein
MKLVSYTYDCSGYCNLELLLLGSIVKNIVLKLSFLIKAASILNFLIIMPYSWAGIIINEFITLIENSLYITSLVLVNINYKIIL